MGYLFGAFLFYTNMITVDDFDNSYQGQFLGTPSFIEIHISEDAKMIPLFKSGKFYENIERKNLELLVKILKEYISNYDEISNDIDALNKYIEHYYYGSYTSMARKSVEKVKKKIAGFVYLFKCENTNAYKIGRTSGSISSRISQLKTANPYIKEVISFKTDDIFEEIMWHEKFKNKNISGEWFDLSEDDINEMIKYYNK